MPIDKKQVKLGDKVTVTVQPKRKRRTAPVSKSEDRRYGPPPFPDDDERLPPRPQTVYLLDGQTGYNPARTVTDRWYLPEEVSFPDLGGFVDISEVAPATRYGGIIGTAFYDPVFIENTFKIDVKNPNTGNVFKRIFYVACLTKTKCDDLGMSVVLGSKEYEISSTNSKYMANKTPEQRLDAVNAQIAAGSTPELIEKRDNILLEIEELLTADYVEPLRWDNEYRDFAVPEAFLKAQADGKTWEVKTTGVFFEPFNPFDTENFKVTEGTFSDDEVAAPKLNGKDIVYVLLAAQNWLVTSTRDTFNRGGDNVVRKRHEIQYQYAPAITTPVQARTATVFSSYARAFYPTPPTQYDPLRAQQTVSYVIGGFERITPPVPDGFAWGPDSTPQRNVIAAYGFNFSFSTGVTLISNCHNRIEQGNTPTERYCGTFLFKEKFYNVFRKTERVAVDPVLIYNGRVDGPDNAGGILLTGEAYDYSYFDTFYPGHGNLDTGTFTTDLRP